jgi:hypothetical protein
LSTIFMPAHSFVAITSSMSLVRARRLVGQLAHQHQDVALAAEQLAHLARLQRARLLLVGRDHRDAGRQLVEVDRLAVHVDERDLRGRHHLGDLRRRVGVDRVHDDRVDLLRDHVLHLTQLLADVVAAVLDLHRRAVLLRRVADTVAQDRQERVVERCHRHADLLGMRERHRQDRGGRGGHQLGLHDHSVSSSPGRKTARCAPPGRVRSGPIGT